MTAGPCGEDTPQMWYDMALAVDPHNPDALFLDAIDIWKSTDGGKTLTDISCGYHTGVTPVASPVHVDNHALAYQPGSSTNLLAGSDGGIYVSNDAANAPQGTAAGINHPATFKDVNLTMNTIEFYGGDISSNFATSSTPFIVGGAQDNGSSYYQFAAGSSCPAAGCQWSQRIGGDGFYARIEPKKGQRVFMESQNGALQRSTTGPAGAYTVGRRPVGRRPPVVHLPVQDRQVRLPDDDLRPHDRGHPPRLGVDQRGRQLVSEQPRPDEGHARRPLVHQPARLRADDERERDRRHERRQRPVRVRARHRHGQHRDLGGT